MYLCYRHTVLKKINCCESINIYCQKMNSLGLCLSMFCVSFVVGGPLSFFAKKFKLDGRIIGGEPVKAGEFLGQVSLQNYYFKTHICGGILIDPMHVVTAAHCHQDEKRIGFVMGDDVSVAMKGSKTRQYRKVVHFVPHPEFEESTYKNDIAVIRVDEPFLITKTFMAMRRSQHTPKIGEHCSVIGWGRTTNDKSAPAVSNDLLKTTVNVMDINFCNSSRSYEGAMKPGMFCAGRHEGGHDTCQGDSGGLITCGGKNELTGVVSFGDICDRPNFPGVYMDISMYKDWIDEIMTSKRLPDYEYSPFPKPSIHGLIDESFGNEIDDQDDDDKHHGSADRPKFMTTIAILFTVIISTTSNCL